MKQSGKREVRSFEGFRREAGSLGDSAGRALVDAGTAVDAFSSIDDGDVVAGDSALGADVDASAASNTLGFVDCNHVDYLWTV